MGRDGGVHLWTMLHGTRIIAAMQRSGGWLAIVAQAKGGQMNDRRVSDEESQLIAAPRSEIRANCLLACQVRTRGLENPERGR
jgi:hypothetical protein